ncbi:MAG: glycosyltransferase family 4 protein [Elusimicrobiota bacterium]
MPARDSHFVASRLALASRRVEGLSGAVRLILEEARAAAAAGWEADVYSEKLDAAAVRAVGARPHRVPRWPWGSWFKRRAFAALAGRAASGHDVVHGHGDLLDQDLLSLHNCVHAAHEAATGNPLPARDATGRMHALQLSQRRFRVLAANSRLMKDDVSRRFGVPAEMIEVVYPGFDPLRFRAGDRARHGTALREELGLTADQPLFGLITSGDFEKRGLTVFLRAFAVASREAPTARALVVGKETRPGPYLKLAQELRISDKIFFRAPTPDVERLYHGLDIYVHAAKWEEFGMTVLEALACGVPVVTGKRVGASELMKEDEFILQDMTLDSLSAAMIKLAGSPALRSRLSEAGPVAAAPYTLAAHGRAVLALYERLRKK